MWRGFWDEEGEVRDKARDEISGQGRDIMSDSMRRLDYGLLQAIKFEHDGYLFHMAAASNTEDPQGREGFETLAAEAGHGPRFEPVSNATFATWPL